MGEIGERDRREIHLLKSEPQDALVDSMYDFECESCFLSGTILRREMGKR